MFIFIFAIFLFTFFSQPCLTAPAVEILPVAVWQGTLVKPWSLSELQEFRRQHPGLKIAHAISPAPLVQPGVLPVEFRNAIAAAISAGDDIAMHMAPWKSLVDRAGVNFQTEPTMFGAPLDPKRCEMDCGLDLSFRHFTNADFKTILALGKAVMNDAGLGRPQAVYFEEGLIAGSQRDVLVAEGFNEDWSGIEVNQMDATLGRFPIAQWNRQEAMSLPIRDLSVVKSRGVMLDHLRFAIHAEIGDLETADKVIHLALQQAMLSQRVVRIPIVFNVNDLLTTHLFMEQALDHAIAAAQAAHVAINDWTAQNSSWNIDRIAVKLAPLVAGSGAGSGDMIQGNRQDVERGTGEPQFIPDDELVITAH